MYKKFFVMLVALIGFILSANTQDVTVSSNNDNYQELLVYNSEETSNCNVKVFEYDGDIRYTNGCDRTIRVKIVYRYKTCSNVNQNGRMVKVWSDWSDRETIYRNLSANYSNATIASGNNCLIYDVVDWDFAE